jgi:WD repeat-containing protein 26
MRDAEREERVRLIIQSLRDLGYAESASKLEAESGHRFESPVVADFRGSILNARWEVAEEYICLLTNISIDIEVPAHLLLVHLSSPYGIPSINLCFILKAMKFLIRRQKYIELLLERSIPEALGVLRKDITPVCSDVTQLHKLSRYRVHFLMHRFSY